MTDETLVSTGRAWVFGDDIDTDVLAPGAYMKAPIEELAQHCLEAVDPDFARNVRPGDIVVAGANFGIGSSREQAAQALKLLGVDVVVAVSFGGLFFRNAFNLGLAALVCPRAGEIAQGDRLTVDVQRGSIRNDDRGTRCPCEPIPGHLADLLRCGGLIPYLQRRLEGTAQNGGAL